MRLYSLLYLCFITFSAVAAMETIEGQVPINNPSAWRTAAKAELDTILEIEKTMPGFFAQTIVYSLKEIGGGVSPIYFGIQASSNTRTLRSSYRRSLTLDFKDLNLLYERENIEIGSSLGEKKEHKLFKAKDAKLKDIKISSESTLSSDKNKIKYTHIHIIDEHMDMNRSIYEALRETYKNAKNKTVASKDFVLSEFTATGFSALRNKKNLHLLESIIVRNFEGLMAQESKLIKDEFSYTALTWVAKIFEMIAALNIQSEIAEGKTLQENQRIYDAFCCLYEAYHHILFVLLSYSYDQRSPLYSYED